MQHLSKLRGGKDSVCLFLSVNRPSVGCCSGQRGVEGCRRTWHKISSPSPTNVSLPLVLQKRRLQSPRIFMALPSMTPCSLFKINTPPHALPPLSKGQARERELEGVGGRLSLEKPSLLAGTRFQFAQIVQVGSLLVPVSSFLGRAVDLVDTDVHAQRFLGFSPSSWQVHPSPHKHHFRPSSPCLGSSCLDVPAQARPPPAELAPSLHSPFFRSLSLHIYFFSLLLLLPCFSPPCHPSPVPEWISLPFSLSDSISPRLSSHPCTSFFVFFSPSPGLASISPPPAGFGLPQPPHLQLSLLPLPPLPSSRPHPTPYQHPWVPFHTGGLCASLSPLSSPPPSPQV